MDDPNDQSGRLRFEESSGLMETPFGQAPEGRTICPRCDSVIEPVPVVYGYPTMATFAAAEAGRVRLGGCVIEPEAPDYRCPICDAALPMVGEPR